MFCKCIVYPLITKHLQCIFQWEREGNIDCLGGYQVEVTLFLRDGYHTYLAVLLLDKSFLLSYASD